MKTKSITKVTLLSVVVMSVITAVTLNSCQKESIKPKIVNTSAKATGLSVKRASASLLLADLNKMMFGMGKGEKSLIPGGADSNSCVVITSDTVTKPHILSYNYGSGCIGSDNKVRSGVATITYSDWDMTKVNNVITVTYHDYSINGTKYNGTFGMTNMGPNGSGNLVIDQVGNFYSLAPQQISADTANISYSYEWIAGEGSSPAADWQFSVTGGCTFAYNSNQSDSEIITSPLIRNVKSTTDCNYIIQGTEYMVHYDPLGVHYQYVDYGNPGGCSGQEALTEDGVTTIVSQ